MNPSALSYEPQPESTAFPEDFLNQIADQLEWAMTYSLRHEAFDGALHIGTWRGRWQGFSISSGEYDLTDDSENYLVVARATGVLSIATTTTNWLDATNYARVYQITTLDGIITAINDARFDPGGLFASSGGSGGVEFKALTFESDLDSTADTDPGNGLFKFNNATQGSATVLYFDNQTEDGQSLTTLWGNLDNAGFIHIQQEDDPTKWQLWRWTAAPIDGTGYRKFTVTAQAIGGSIEDAKVCFVTFTNDTNYVKPRVESITSSATPTPNADTTDTFIITALAIDPTFGAPTGSPTEGQQLVIRLKDNGATKALAFNAIYRSIGTTFPVATTASKTMYLGFMYNAVDNKWDFVSVREEA